MVLPLIFAMQVGPAAPAPAPPPPDPAPSGSTPALPVPAPSESAPSAPAPPAPSNSAPAPPDPAPPASAQAISLSPPNGPPILVADVPIKWFLRGAVGFGPPAFSDQVDLLSLEGYGGAKVWVAADGGYFAHPNVGVGGLLAFSRWATAPVPSHRLEENALFLCIGAPVRVGTRFISFLGAPRLGLAVGKQSLGGEAPSQVAFAWGLDVSAVSFQYHLSVSAGLLFAGVGPPGELGRNHNLGGLWLAIGGVYGRE